MQRRLDIAMALVHDPQVLFLDEPTTGLDPEVRTDMWQEIARLAAEQGKTVLLTTHYLEEADQLAARLAIVDRGKVVAAGDTGGAQARAARRRGPRRARRADDPTARVSRGARAIGAGPRRDASTAGRCAPVPTTAAARCRACSRRSRPTAISVASVRVARPSLDDVYLRYTGRTFDAAEAEAARR